MQIKNTDPDSAERTALGAAFLAAAMALPMAAPAHAESPPERGFVGMKYLDYLDSQPGDNRIQVRAKAVTVIAPVYSDWSISGTFTSDAISGASPAYQSSGLGAMHDERHALDASATRYFPNGTLTLGANVSSESDYLSRGLSLQMTSANESKNTTWSAGIGLNSDEINPSNGIVKNESKHITDLLLGVTQVLTVNDIVQLNVGMSWGTGYFSDPYKFADDRPRTRDHSTLMVRWNHHMEASQGTLRSSYRYYTDSWSITAHTLGLEYVQPLMNGWSVTPLMRVYSQGAASFYVASDDSSYPFAPSSTSNYSEDQRVSAFGAHTYGLKVAKRIDQDWTADVKLEQYEQRAEWRLSGSGTPGMLPFSARSLQLGISRQF